MSIVPFSGILGRLLRSLDRTKSTQFVHNLLIVLALVLILCFMKLHEKREAISQQQDQLPAILVTSLRQELEHGGISVKAAQAQGTQIAIIGPPDGVLYERVEGLTLRWRAAQPLTDGQIFVIAVAYYEPGNQTDYTTTYFTTSEETYRLPDLRISEVLAFLAWTVYVADDASRSPVGPTSETYRLLHLFFLPPSLGYMGESGDPGF